MSLVESFFAPRTDHRGWSTPSEAARLFFLITLVCVAVWAWGKTTGNLAMWFGLTCLVATPVLSVGWWLISLISVRYTPRVLTEAVNNVQKHK